VGKNIIHGSDSAESAERELALWFGAENVVAWKRSEDEHIYE
ncbi:nucleoside diphosphate kinase, partial [Kipferlia bialata]